MRTYRSPDPRLQTVGITETRPLSDAPPVPWWNLFRNFRAWRLMADDVFWTNRRNDRKYAADYRLWKETGCWEIRGELVPMEWPPPHELKAMWG